jgi:hypothetical protein
MIEKLSIEKGTPSKIYGLAYDEPISGYKIAKEIGTQPHHINDKIKKMHKQGYLIKIRKPEWRWPRWQSDVKALVMKVDNIKKHENINLTELDKEVLYNRLNAKYFRSLVPSTIKNLIKEKGNIDSVDEILGFFEMLILLMEQDKHYVQECMKITNKKKYEEAISNQLKAAEDLRHKIKFKEFSDKIKDKDIPKLHKQLEKNLNKKIPIDKLKSLIQEFRDSKQLSLVEPGLFEKVGEKLGSKEALNDIFINSFITPIPKNLLVNYRGISSIGRKYLEIEEYVERIWEMRILHLFNQDF